MLHRIDLLQHPGKKKAAKKSSKKKAGSPMSPRIGGVAAHQFCGTLGIAEEHA
eukprot:gene9426-biopygen7363